LTKKRVEKPHREVTKHQLSRWQQQRKRQRIVFGAGVFIIVTVLGILGAGWYITQYQPLHQTVIKVNDTEFDMNYYIKMLKHYGQGQTSQYIQYVADEIARVIEQNELIRQGAGELGITVSNEEVDEELKSRDPPLSKDYRDLVRTEMLINKLRDEHFERKVPLFDEQRSIMAMFLESASQAAAIRARLKSGESFTELASKFSLDGFTKNKNGDLGWQPRGILTPFLGSSIPEEFAFNSKAGVISQPLHDEDKVKMVGYWLIKVLERKQEEEEAHVQAILLGNAEEAKNIRARLETGEDFAALAKELSQLGGAEENGGDLSWLPPDIMSSAFDEFVFNSEVGTLSEPVRDDTAATMGGYWLIKIIDKDDYRQVEDENRDLMKAKALEEWVSSLWDEGEVESYLDASNKSWAIAKATKELGR